MQRKTFWEPMICMQAAISTSRWTLRSSSRSSNLLKIYGSPSSNLRRRKSPMFDLEEPKEKLPDGLSQQPEFIKVLLIEDNPGDARLVKEMLVEAGANQFSLTHVGLISTGLSVLRDQDFHLIL